MTRNNHISTGNKGERIAIQFLRSRGYDILEHNWRWSTLEIDLICKKEDQLIFVEVKYRKNARYGEPVDFVSDAKMENLSIAAAHYLDEKSYNGPIRFDVIGIRPGNGQTYKIRHLKDVFFAGWGG